MGLVHLLADGSQGLGVLRGRTAHPLTWIQVEGQVTVLRGWHLMHQRLAWTLWTQWSVSFSGT